MKDCPEPHCYAPIATCVLGEPSHASCPRWQSRHETKDPVTTDAEVADGLRLPWHGNALGQDDLGFLSARARQSVVAVVGPQGAGKSTLLGAMYLACGSSADRKGGKFAGSFTLEGWENLAHSLSWSESGGPAFPMHTPTAGRFPGLLHLALRHTDHSVHDVLFSDAPGEWFRRWAVDRDAPDAAGARWLSTNATCYVLLADSERLSGSSPGVARNLLELLIDRIASERKSRPVVLVWSKSDKTVPEEIRRPLSERAFTAIPDLQEMHVTVYQASQNSSPIGSFLAVLDWVAGHWAKPGIITPVEETPSDCFWAYGT